MKDRINYYIFLPAIFFLFFLETTFFAQAFWNFPLPNLVALFFLSAVFLSCSADFLYLAFALGFLFDLLSGSNFGIFMLSFVFFAIISYYLKEKFLQEESFLRIVLTAVLSMLAFDVIYLALSSLVFNVDLPAYYEFIRKRVLFDVLAAAIVVYPAMRFISKR